ncbi:hypothetical protein M513_04878 [Trichuris suis]|uniref:Uncharacterized protein n=1 Tax=Trichuris suis TaxID=68888 RepID=A0A085MAU0_9BILA|nr:hypothetical protein M513_04878 [Trichuris suis]
MDVIHGRYSGAIFKSPVSILYQWEMEVKQRLSHALLCVCVHHGQKRENKIFHDGSGPDNIAGTYSCSFKVDEAWISSKV